jgi:glycosyltransferase involved in cell wall biosynthesis
MAEALACGTPVVARRCGSVPELITDGVTGLIGSTDEELVARCERVRELDRTTCRRAALRHFSSAVLAAG